MYSDGLRITDDKLNWMLPVAGRKAVACGERARSVSVVLSTGYAGVSLFRS